MIIHGTDTLSYAAAVLAHCLGDRVRVVLTGSQYPLLSSDGLDSRNFSDALDNLNLALDALQYYPQGVYLAFHHQVFHARSALKQHSIELDAFTGLDAKQALTATKALQIASQDIIKAQDFNCLNIMAQPIGLAQLRQNLAPFRHATPHCLILQGFGTANLAVDSELLALFHDLYAKNCAIVLTSQVPFGHIEQHYAINSWLAEAPVILSHELGHADLYAKTLKMYLQYPHVEQWLSLIHI